jgi:hypothetical protein
MNFANIITNNIVEALPSVMVDGDQTITGADITHWAKRGWRKIVTIDSPATGYRVGTYGIEAIDGLTCKLTVATSINLADEAAAQAAAKAAAAAQYIVQTKDAAKTLSEVSVTSTGRVIRALCTLLLQEINALRTKAGMANYTSTQFLNALKAKIDEQT